MVVLGDGEHHNATVTTLDFLGNRSCVASLRLYPHTETEEKATNRDVAVARKTNGRTSVRPFVDFAMFLNEAYFDFFCVPFFFFAMALLLRV